MKTWRLPDSAQKSVDLILDKMSVIISYGLGLTMAAGLIFWCATYINKYVGPYPLGSEVILKADKSGESILALPTEKSGIEKLNRILSAQDDVGLREMLSNGQLIPVVAGTHCKIIDRGGLWTYQVRILDGASRDMAVWIRHSEVFVEQEE